MAKHPIEEAPSQWQSIRQKRSPSNATMVAKHPPAPRTCMTTAGQQTEQARCGKTSARAPRTNMTSMANHLSGRNCSGKVSTKVATNTADQGEDVEWEHKKAQVTITKPVAKVRRIDIKLMVAKMGRNPTKMTPSRGTRLMTLPVRSRLGFHHGIQI